MATTTATTTSITMLYNRPAENSSYCYISRVELIQLNQDLLQSFL